jgi:superoxide dismutase, Fe-Mn family
MKNIRWENVFQRYGAAVTADAQDCGAGTAAVSEAPQLVDVRRAQTYADAKDQLAGASWNDPTQVAQWSQALDRAKPVLVYCAHGLDIGRSTALALRARGFDARFLSGGIEAWRSAGLPVQPRGDAS